MHQIRIATLAGLALVSAGLTAPARADDVPDNGAFMQRLFATKTFDKKTYACFVRKYDAAHLAQHPRQKVTAMKLLVAVEKVPEDEGSMRYTFRVGTNLRNKRANYSSGGDCGHAQANTKGGQIDIQCSVDCDGGGITVALEGGDKAVTLRLVQMAIWDDSKPDADPSALQAGSDDGIFRLDRVDAEQCASLVTDRDEQAALRRK